MKNLEMRLLDLGGLGMIGLAIYGAVKLIQLSGIAKKVDMSIKDLSASTPVDIQQAVVDKAIDRAVDREVRKAVQDTARRVSDEVRSDIRKEVKDAVKSQYSDISDKVTKRVAEEVKNIHQDDIMKRITDRAEDMVVDRINEETRKVMVKFNKGLDGVVDIYDGIARRIMGTPAPGANNASQGLTFTVGR